MADVRARTGWHGNLQRLQAKVNLLKADAVTSAEIQTHLESLETVWRKVNVIQDKLMATCTDDDAVKVQMAALEPIEDCYCDIKTKLYQLKPPADSASRHTSSIKLPEMSLPTFDGKFEDWQTFQDLFLSSVDRNKFLSGSQKLQYLKTCTKGEAASLIKSFIITDANYVEAWQLLEQQYDNKREIIHSHVKKLILQPSLKTESATSLQQMLTTTLESIRSLKVLGRPVDQWDDLITVILIEKLDCETKAEWAKSLTGTSPPTFQEFQDFLQQHIRMLHAKGSVKTSSSQRQHSTSHGKRINVNHTSTTATCSHCKGTHFLYQCIKLREMDEDKRYAAVKATGVCMNCLSEGHSTKCCTSARTCRKCSHRHNTFLHMDSLQRKSVNFMTAQQQTSNSTNSNNQNSSSNSSSTNSNSSSKVGIHNSSFSSDSHTLLKTALVDVLDSTSTKRSLRVFIDEGGQGSLIRESSMHQLGLKKEKVNITITGVGGVTVAKSKWKTYVRLYSQINNCSIDVELFAVPKVNSDFTKLAVGTPQDWSHIAGLQLADPYFHQGGDIDILIGSNIAPYILGPGLKQHDMSSPVAQETIFGWVLFGNIGTAPQKSFTIHNFKCEISDALRRFWEIEEVPSHQSLKQEEEACEQHFLQTHKRQPDGRYTIRLPFNSKKALLGDSYDQALRRLHSLERRFKRQPQHKEAYVQFMREYEALGHMEKVPKSLNKVTNSFYLPHHFVVKEDITTTKQRTVFDGSARTTTGTSLNETLMVGATVQPDLYTLLLCFRYNRVALKADVAKMYRQFPVHEDDRNYQKILWREDSSQPVQEYRLTTVTYGTSCAPFLATRALNQLALDEKLKYPAASQALLTATYVDDFLGTSPSTAAAINLVKEMIGITASAGMEIRKWCSNDLKVMAAIPEQLREISNTSSFDDSNLFNKIKALGIQWEPSSDQFLFNVSVNSSPLITKRFVLSEISKTFDPVGWLSPVTVNSKLLLQKVWLEGTDWDHVLSPQLQEEWKTYIMDLLQIKQVRISRCVILSSPMQLELHGYCDSSELCYASAIYLKCIYKDRTITVHLLTSRTRVAPIKHVSLPKLELCGAALLAETMDVVRKTIPHVHTIYCWTDSTITLRWISAHSRKWKIFVANRVSLIQTLVPPEHWHHVKSEDNPADLPSRGISTQQLLSSSLWWHGPSWLTSNTYPLSTPTSNEEEVKKEERAKQLACFHLALNSVHTQPFSAFSSFNKLCRCTAYLIRFIIFLKNKKKIIIKSPLTSLEITSAKRKLIEWVQAVSFPEDIHGLRKKAKLPCSSKLHQLTPYIDGNGLLRVGGRIQNAELPESTRHPLILPHNHQLTQLIIRDAHLNNLHGGFTITYATLRRTYWILRGRDTIRQAIRACIICRRAKAATAEQLMGNLPVGRVTANRPFLHAGVDYAGPFQTKLKKGRHVSLEKTYLAIFVCLSTKAVHLEAVSSLSSDAFIACYERFVSRRGISAHLYSDCGTNFVGADKILREFLSSEQSRFQNVFSSRGTQWHFNPPSSPHQGGLWEAGVKSVKYHFRRVTGQQILTLEQFQTLLCKIESCLNSRPLCPLSSDPADLDALTPGHFLIGEPLTNIPEPSLSSAIFNRLEHWEIVRHMTQHFWKRWTNEYLTSLQQRFKWTEKRENLQLGDLVVIADDQCPVAKWRIGRVVIVHPGSGDLVRSATVKTLFGELRRPVTKLAPLILQSEM